MGNNHSHQRSRKTSTNSLKSSELYEIQTKIREKEYVFIAMQEDIDKTIAEKSRCNISILEAEIVAHIIDLKQIPKTNLSSLDRGRIQRIIYNFEISLAKLKSVFNLDTLLKKKRDLPTQTPSAEPDIVSDSIRFDNTERRSSLSDHRTTLPTVSENSASSARDALTRNNSLYSKVQPQNFEETLLTIQSEYGVIQDQSKRPVADVSDYYLMDKGIFYLYVKLKQLELPSDNMNANRNKFALLGELVEFRKWLDQKAGEMEAQKEIEQDITTLELLFDSSSKREMSELENRALLLQERVESMSWEPSCIKNKVELLNRIAMFVKYIACNSDFERKHSLSNSIKLYGNLNLVKGEAEEIKDHHEEPIYGNHDILLRSDEYFVKGDEEAQENIYGNIELIRQNDEKVTRPVDEDAKSSTVCPQRGTVYMNQDVIGQNINYENHSIKFNGTKNQSELVKKPPLPLPRNYEEKVINDLPKHWTRLNEIFEQELISETDNVEVEDIHKHLEVAKNLFERKIRKILDKFEDSVDM